MIIYQDHSSASFISIIYQHHSSPTALLPFLALLEKPSLKKSVPLGSDPPLFSGKTNSFFSNTRPFFPLKSPQKLLSSSSGQVRSNSDSNSNSKVGPELHTKIGFHHSSATHSPLTPSPWMTQGPKNDPRGPQEDPRIASWLPKMI